MNPEIIKRFRRSMRRRNVCRIDADTARRFIKFLNLNGVQVYIRKGSIFIGVFSTLFGEERFLRESPEYLGRIYQLFLKLNGINA